MNQIEQLGIVLEKLLSNVLKASNKEPVEIIQEIESDLNSFSYLNFEELLTTSNDILALKIQTSYNLYEDSKDQLSQVLIKLSQEYSKVGNQEASKKLKELASMVVS